MTDFAIKRFPLAFALLSAVVAYITQYYFMGTMFSRDFSLVKAFAWLAIAVWLAFTIFSFRKRLWQGVVALLLAPFAFIPITLALGISYKCANDISYCP